MIHALEGPDGAGKSTLFEQLRRDPRLKHCTFVGSVPLTRALFNAFSDVELRDSELWWLLYDKERVYVCDRHVAISAPVYDRVHSRRELVDWRRWVPHVYVLYLSLNEEALRQRLSKRGDEFFDADKLSLLLRHYEWHVPSFSGTSLDARRLDLAEVVAKHILAAR